MRFMYKCVKHPVPIDGEQQLKELANPVAFTVPLFL